MHIDFHMHSVYSDGTMLPQELVDLAEQAGIRALALTDHDTISGVQKMRECATEAGIGFVYGIEVSAIFPTGGLHILGYGFNPKNTEFQTKISELNQARGIRNRKIIEKLQSLGIFISIEKIKEKQQVSDGVLGRPHIAAELVAQKAVKNFRDAFDRYLGNHAVAYVDKEIFTATEVFEFIRKAGGKSFIAHPVSLNLEFEKLSAYLKSLKNIGLDGIEIFNSSVSPRQSLELQKIAEEFDFLTSGGSDFHGFNKKHIQMGTFAQGRMIDSSEISYEFFEKICV